MLLHGKRTLESDGELGRIQKEAIMAYLRYNCLQILRGKTQKPPARKASLSIKN